MKQDLHTEAFEQFKMICATFITIDLNKKCPFSLSNDGHWFGNMGALGGLVWKSVNGS